MLSSLLHRACRLFFHRQHVIKTTKNIIGTHQVSVTLVKYHVLDKVSVWSDVMSICQTKTELTISVKLVEWPSICLWQQTYCLLHILFLSLTWPEVRRSAVTWSFFVVKQITLYGRDSLWAVDIIWTLERLGRINMASPCADRCAVTSLLRDRVLYTVSTSVVGVSESSSSLLNSQVRQQVFYQAGDVWWLRYVLCYSESFFSFWSTVLYS